MNLEVLRNQIDSVDDKILKLFIERMIVIENIAQIKKSEALPTENTLREEQILNNVANNTPEKFQIYSNQLFKKLFELSKALQIDISSK